MGLSRGASALGVAKALGEVDVVKNEDVCRRWVLRFFGMGGADEVLFHVFFNGHSRDEFLHFFHLVIMNGG